MPSTITQPSGSTFIGCRLSCSGVQTVNNSTTQALTWDTDRTNPYGFHSTSTNPTRITIPASFDGNYFLNLALRVDAVAGGSISVSIRVNNSLIFGRQGLYSSTVGAAHFAVIGLTLYSLLAGDYVELVLENTSGGACTVDNSGSGTNFYSPEVSFYKI
jgi:hypothetical protein